jgi:PAS domain S-box-containing protein
MPKTRLPMPSSAHRPARILAIDDEPIVRESIAAYLEDSGFEILQAQDGRIGLQMLRGQKPDLVLLDLRMPEMDGLEFLDLMQREVPETPVIVVSGTGVLQDAIAALRAGAHDFVTKPILDMAVLEHAVRSALERSHLREENRRYREHLESEIAQRTADLVERTQALEASNRQLKEEIQRREKVEATLRSREQKFRELADLLPQTVFEADREGRFTFVNRYGLEILAGGVRAALDGLKVLDCFQADCRPAAAAALDQVLAGEGPVELETVAAPQERTAFPAMVYASPVSHSGQTSGLRGILFDLTAIRQAEEALRASEAHLRKENLRLRSSIREAGRFGRIIGKSPSMQDVFEIVLKAADTNANVIIYGESGTGKELVAHTIHDLSERRQGRFVPVNCGAIPENLLESEFFGYRRGAFTGATKDKPGLLAEADGGTLFLDEIGEITPSLQVKLLRAIEGGGFTPIGSSEVILPNIRVIAATNRSLLDEVHKGRLREDFYYRIHIIPIHLPPIRERREDIPLLIQHFLDTMEEEKSIPILPEHVIRSFQNRNWPGNVRELRNAVQRYVTLEALDPADPPAGSGVPAPFTAQPAPAAPLGLPLDEARAQNERQHILNVLNANQWHRSRAARQLGIDRRTLFRKMRRYGIK